MLKTHLKRIVFLCFFVCPSMLKGQNLIVDGSFEEYPGYPSYRDSHSAITMKSSDIILKHWCMPYNVTPDYFHDEGNRNAIKVAKDGKGYVGLVAGNSFDGNTIYNYREYIQGKLKEKLQSNKKYYLKCYVLLSPESNYAADGFGVYFSTASVDSVNKTGNLSFHPQIENTKGRIIRDKKKWTEISGSFIASGDERFVILGNFNTNESTNWKKLEGYIPKPGNYAYYYLDDVSLISIPNENKVKDRDTTLLFSELNIEKKFFFIDQTIILNKINFENNKFVLLPESYEILDKLILLMKSNLTMEIEVRGHTDNNGQQEQNNSLSLNRAKSVVNYLKNKGINDIRMSYNGYGSSKPLKDNVLEEGKKMNRRVDFVIKKT